MTPTAVGKVYPYKTVGPDSCRSRWRDKEPVLSGWTWWQTGWSASNLARALEARKGSLLKTYDFVFLSIGVNDQVRGTEPEAVFRPQIQSLLQCALQFADNMVEHLLVLSIPNWRVTPAAAAYVGPSNIGKITIGIGVLNGIVQEECMQRQIVHVDITPSSEGAEFDLSLLASDGLHPSGKMYSIWVDMLAEVVLPKLQGREVAGVAVCQ